MAAGLDGIIEVGPVFRAEPSRTARHLTEFTGVDVEIAWVGSHEDVMDLGEDLLVAALTAVRDLGVDVAVPARPFPRLTVDQARAALIAEQVWVPPADDDGALDPAGERALGRLVRARHGHDFAFVTEYPSSARPSYHLRPPGRPEVTNSFDLLMGGVEITTGAQREHRHDVLVAQARAAGMDVEAMAGYLDAFRWGCPPHGGFGLGVERLTTVLLGLPNVRAASFLPRTPTRLVP